MKSSLGCCPLALALASWKVSVRGGEARFKSRLAVPAQPVVTRTKSLRSVSDALTLLLVGSHQHLPVLNRAQSPSPPPRLERRPPRDTPGCSRAGSCTGSCLFSCLELRFWTLPGSAPECGGVFLPLCLHWFGIQVHVMHSRNGHRGFRAVNRYSLRPAQQSATAPSQKDFPFTLKWPLASRSHVFKSARSKTYMYHKASL